MWAWLADWTRWWWIPALSVAIFVAGLVAARWFVLCIPPDYFQRDRPLLNKWLSGHPLPRCALLLAKNLLGIGLLATGLLMLVTPGPGIVAVLCGIALVDLPGKRQLQRWLVSRPSVLKAMNSARQKAGRPPLEVRL
jgi:hypothetical protein